MKVYSHPCQNCLFSKEAIVSPKRVAQVLQDCVETQTFFICHKASIKGEEICCSTFYERMSHLIQAVKIEQFLGTVIMVPREEEEIKLPSYREMEGI